MSKAFLILSTICFVIVYTVQYIVKYYKVTYNIINDIFYNVNNIIYTGNVINRHQGERKSRNQIRNRQLLFFI